MRIAVLSDIHGNHIALNECLKHAKGQNVDRYVFLGDYLGEFPYQQKTMGMLYELNDKEKCLFIRGNKEDYWLDRKKNVNCEWINGNSSVGVMKYNFENINDKDFAFFEAMPISTTIEIEGMPSILFCHGTPISNSTKLLPDNDTTDELLKNILENYIVCGHTHIQRSFFIRAWGECPALVRESEAFGYGERINAGLTDRMITEFIKSFKPCAWGSFFVQ